MASQVEELIFQYTLWGHDAAIVGDDDFQDLLDKYGQQMKYVKADASMLDTELRLAGVRLFSNNHRGTRGVITGKYSTIKTMLTNG